MTMKVIIVTGSVGTGKTTISKKLAEKLNFDYVDVNRIIKKYDVSEGYDKKRKTKIIDTKKLNKVLIKEIKKLIKKGIIIDSHLSHYLPKKYVDLCIVTKCNLKVLEKRFKKRRYSEAKIRENLDTEIFDVCMTEAEENKLKVLALDTTKPLNIKNIINKIGII